MDLNGASSQKWKCIYNLAVFHLGCGNSSIRSMMFFLDILQGEFFADK